MVFAGIDIGAATAKAVIIDNGNIQYSHIIATGDNVKMAASEVVDATLAMARMGMNDLDYIVSTGYGRNAVTFANETSSEIICHAKGAYSVIPRTRVIIDIGGQDSKAIEVDQNGRVTGFVMNDKCAAGTGRFLEVIANVLKVKLEELGPVSLLSSRPCPITSTCTVFAESEIVSLRADGRSREDLIAGVHRAIAYRTKLLMKSAIRLQREVVFTGGVAKNVGVRKALAGELGVEILVPEKPQIIGALGAALLAKEAFVAKK
jgi:predicted CoA-substrate-specific enzyme activase